MERELQRLLDEREIERRLIEYCRGVDRGDTELVASVYHPDGTDDHGSFQGLGIDFAHHVTRRLAERYEATMHSIGNVSIRFDRDDTALVESHVTGRHRGRGELGPTLMTFGGRYVDRFERRQGQWKIAHRTVVHEFDHVERLEPAYQPSHFTEGIRSREDPSYGDLGADRAN